MFFTREALATGTGISPWRHAALAQLFALLPALAAMRWANLAPELALLLQAGTAVALSMLWRQPRWWWLLHAGFLPTVVAAQQLQWPAWIWLLALLLSWAVFGAVHRSRVPLYLSNWAALAALDTLLPAQGRVLDVGAGTGTVLAHLARRPGLQLSGIEHAWLPWLLARLRLGASPVRLLRGDWTQLDFADYDLIYAYLSPAAMPALWAKASREMRPGSLLVSNRFGVNEARCSQRLAYGSDEDHCLYVWRFDSA